MRHIIPWEFKFQRDSSCFNFVKSTSSVLMGIEQRLVQLGRIQIRRNKILRVPEHTRDILWVELGAFGL